MSSRALAGNGQFAPVSGDDAYCFFKFSFFAVGPWVLLARLIIRGATHFSLHCALVRARTLSRAPANPRLLRQADMARGDADADVLGRPRDVSILAMRDQIGVQKKNQHPRGVGQSKSLTVNHKHKL